MYEQKSFVASCEVIFPEIEPYKLKYIFFNELLELQV
jgi:hypothetical protein